MLARIKSLEMDLAAARASQRASDSRLALARQRAELAEAQHAPRTQRPDKGHRSRAAAAVGATDEPARTKAEVVEPQPERSRFSLLETD